MDENEQRYARLAKALKERVEGERLFVPPYVDEAILKKAREQFGAKEPPRTQGLWWRWILGGAVAMLALGLFLPATKRTSWVREDINHDGRVDILDALALARAIEAGQGAGQNESDVRRIALKAVRLEAKSGI